MRSPGRPRGWRRSSARRGLGLSGWGNSAWLVVGLMACGKGDAGPGELTLSPDILDFGEVAVGTDATLEVVLDNASAVDEDVLSVSVTSGSTSIWSSSRNSDTAAAGGSLAIDVVFSPDAEEAYTGELQVRTASTTFYVALSGTGTPSTEDLDGDGYSPATGDCDEEDPEVHPGAEELCNGEDDDCDGVVPADEADDDGDGYHLCDGDCDDTDSNVYPDAVEICDDKDTDCDGVSADHDDRDGDGYTVCTGDCDDDEALAYPGAIEVCDGVDNDCNGADDELDGDGDGHTVCHPAGDCDDTDPSAYPVIVDPDAKNSGLGTEDAPYETIQEGLDNLDSTCRTVWVAAGTHGLAASLSGTRVTIAGESLAGTVLVPEDKGRMLQITGGADVTLRALTVSGGVAQEADGGAVLVVDSDLTADRVLFAGNHADADGGAIAGANARVTLRDARLEGNDASDDGGAVSMVGGSLIVDGTEFTGNHGTRGGAILVDAGLLELVDSELFENSSDDEGGALDLVGSPAVTVERTWFALNSAGGQGGAVALNAVVDPDGAIRNCRFQDNGSSAEGGAIGAFGKVIALGIHNNTFTANTSSGHGAAVWATPADGALLDITANLGRSHTGASGLYLAPGAGVSASYNSIYQTSSGADFAGAVSAGVNSNDTLDALFVDFNNDGDPFADDLELSAGSPARDAGPPDKGWRDVDGTTNDRGYTGGPYAEGS